MARMALTTSSQLEKTTDTQVERSGCLEQGGCSCGKTQFEVHFPKPLAEYVARRCDCDFCVARNIEYLSDPDATLKIPRDALESFDTQGSEQARFLKCAENSCGEVFAVVYENSGKYYGAVNKNRLVNASVVQESQTVSPKKLSSDVKSERWQQLWCKVEFV